MLSDITALCFLPFIMVISLHVVCSAWDLFQWNCVRSLLCASFMQVLSRLLFRNVSAGLLMVHELYISLTR